MRRTLVSVFAALLIGALVFPTSAGADDDQEFDTYPVCHIGKKSVKLLHVEAADVEEHLGHGDAQPGDPVPGMDGYVFDDDCVLVLVNYLVRAISTDTAGNTRVISELLDTNGDGYPSVGDTVKLYGFPTDFAAASYSPFWTTECVLDSYVVVYNPADRLRVVGASFSDPLTACFVLWVDIYGLVEQFLAVTPDRFVSLTDGERTGTDGIQDNPGGDNLFRSSTTDDQWLDIEFNFTP